MLTKREWLPPLVGVELTRAGRAKMLYLLRAAPLVFVVIELGFHWLWNSQFGRFMAFEVQMVASTVSLCAFWIIGPVAAAGAIAGQREAGTSDLLELVSINARNLYAAALAVVMLQVWAVMISVAPLAALAGETPSNLARFALASGASAFAIASLGLLCSAYSQNAPEALIRCYGILIAIVAIREPLYELGGMAIPGWLRLRTDLDSMNAGAFAVQIIAGIAFSFFAIRRIQKPGVNLRRYSPRKLRSGGSINASLRAFMSRALHVPLPIWENLGWIGRGAVVCAAVIITLFMPYPIMLLVPLSLMLMISVSDRLKRDGRLEELWLTPSSREGLGNALGWIFVLRWLPFASVLVGARLGFALDGSFAGPQPWYIYPAAAAHGLGSWWLIVWLGLYNAYAPGPVAYRTFLAVIMYGLYEFILVSCLGSAIAIPFFTATGAPPSVVAMDTVRHVTAPFVLLAIGLRVRGLWLKRFLAYSDPKPPWFHFRPLSSERTSRPEAKEISRGSSERYGRRSFVL